MAARILVQTLAQTPLQERQSKPSILNLPDVIIEPHGKRPIVPTPVIIYTIRELDGTTGELVDLLSQMRGNGHRGKYWRRVDIRLKPVHKFRTFHP